MAENAVANGAAKRERLVQRREALGLTQENLAGLLDVERSTIVRWERGETLRADGEPARAGDAWRQALTIFDDLGHPSTGKVLARLAALDPRERAGP